MPTAISAANFATALGNCHDAISSGDWSGARKYYAMAKAQHAGLMATVTDQGQTQTRASALKELAEAIAIAEAGAGQAADDERRFITTRTRHP